MRERREYFFFMFIIMDRNATMDPKLKVRSLRNHLGTCWKC